MSHLHSWIRRLFARFPRPASCRANLGCEALERRDTPTFTSIGVAFNQLTFEGDSDPDDLLVTLGADGFLRHNLTQPDLASDADFDTAQDGEQKHRIDGDSDTDADIVRLIIVAARGGNNRIQIDAPVRAFLYGGDGDDVLVGGPLDDSFVTGTGTDTFDGRGGSDNAVFYISAVTGAIIDDTGSTLTGVGLLDDGVTPAAFTATGANVEHYDLVGTEGDDTLNATGFSGSVAFNALGGNNVLIGGSGNDHLIAGDGNNTIRGNGGDDIVDVGAGANAFAGGPGVDSLRVPFVSTATITNTQLAIDGRSYPGHGFEHIERQGTDAPAVVLAAGFTNGSIDVFLGAGNDVVIGTPNADRIAVGVGNNFVDPSRRSEPLLGGRTRRVRERAPQRDARVTTAPDWVAPVRAYTEENPERGTGRARSPWPRSAQRLRRRGGPRRGHRLACRDGRV